MCQLENDEVFHIKVESINENTNIFTKQSPNPSAWEISNSQKQSTLRQLDVCFNNVDTFIKTMQYSYDNMEDLCWVHTNKMKLKK